MRAKFIYEIYFERNKDPKIAMDIGAFEFNVNDNNGNNEYEKKKTRSWLFNNIRVLEVEGEITSERADFKILLSNYDKIIFSSFLWCGPPISSRSKDYAEIQINDKTYNVTEEYKRELEQWGSNILTVLKIYEEKYISSIVNI